MRLGVLGGGQLARMLALAGAPLGVRVRVLDPAADACAVPYAEHLQAAYDDPEALARFAEGLDAVTFDFENVPAQSASTLAQHLPVHPNAHALAVAQDRLSEKNLFVELGIPTPGFRAVDSMADIQTAVEALGLPAVLKTRRLGYDGKGQFVLRDTADIAAAWSELGGVPLILEAFVAFHREVSQVAVRARDGETRAYPLTENVHRDGILRVSRSPCDDNGRAAAARSHTERLLAHLDYVGVLAVEFFDTEHGLVANEMAPRVHNSGHWTIEGAETSQFENHVRAVLGLPLGSTEGRGHVAMVNFIGCLPDRAAFLSLPGAHWHDYGKSPRPGRKVGHGTLCGKDLDEVSQALEVAADRADQAAAG